MKKNIIDLTKKNIEQITYENVIAITINISTEENNIGKLYISLRELNDNNIGYGYKFGNQEKIWSIVSHDENGNYLGSTNNLYCAQANYGSSWESRESGSLGTRTVVTYNLAYDFNKEIETTPSKQQIIETMFFILRSLSSAQKKNPTTGITGNTKKNGMYDCKADAAGILGKVPPI